MESLPTSPFFEDFPPYMETSSRIIEPYSLDLISQFPQMAISVKETTSKDKKESTKKTYGSHINGIYGWIAFVEQFNTKHGHQFNQLPNNVNIEKFIELIILFIEAKCVTGYNDTLGIKLTKNNLALNPSTGWIVYSALQDYFVGNMYFGERNPLNHPSFENYKSGLYGYLKKCLREAGQNGSKPLYYEDLQKIYGFVYHNYDHLFQHWFMAIISICYSCFFRINEVLTITFKNIHFETDRKGNRRIRIVLLDRKTIEDKKITYFIYNNAEEDAANAFYFITKYQEELVKMGLTSTQYGSQSSDELYFGRWTKTGLLFDSIGQGYSSFSNLLKEMFSCIGLESKDYSTHTFRKGGVRHRYLFAKNRWPMDYILAWANWSFGDDKKVLFSYLVDEERLIQTEDIQMAMLHVPVANDTTALFNIIKSQTDAINALTKRVELLQVPSINTGNDQ
jgi:integrase